MGSSQFVLTSSVFIFIKRAVHSNMNCPDDVSQVKQPQMDAEAPPPLLDRSLSSRSVLTVLHLCPPEDL